MSEGSGSPNFTQALPCFKGAESKFEGAGTGRPAISRMRQPRRMSLNAQGRSTLHLASMELCNSSSWTASRCRKWSAGLLSAWNQSCNHGRSQWAAEQNHTSLPTSVRSTLRATRLGWRHNWSRASRMASAFSQGSTALGLASNSTRQPIHCRDWPKANLCHDMGKFKALPRKINKHAIGPATRRGSNAKASST